MTAVAEFTLPAELEAHAPPEARGLPRDGVRMLVSRAASGAVTHHRFTDLPRLLLPGDLLVVNTSRTLPAAVPAGPDLAIHFSTARPDGSWLVEPRIPAGKSSLPSGDAPPPPVIALPGGAELTMAGRATARLWRARLSTAVVPYLLRHGEPIRYSYAGQRWPLEAYQTVFGRVPRQRRDAERGPAVQPRGGDGPGRAGVTFAPITLHCGVSSLEAGEDPYAEQYDVPPATARLVDADQAVGRPGDRGRHHRRPRPGDHCLGSYCPGGPGRLDIARGHPGDGPAGSGRAAHRAARAALLAPADAGRVPGEDLLRDCYEAALARRLPLARIRRRPPATTWVVPRPPPGRRLASTRPASRAQRFLLLSDKDMSPFSPTGGQLPPPTRPIGRNRRTNTDTRGCNSPALRDPPASYLF